MKNSRNVIWLGSLVLVATAAFHSTGYATVVRDTAAADVSEFLGSAAKGLWLYVSYHWLFIAILAAVASGFHSRLSRIVLTLSASVISVDALLLLVYVGPFVGEILLAVVAAAYVSGAILQRRHT